MRKRRAAVLEIAVKLDVDATFGLLYPIDASTQPTATITAAGLSALVTRRVEDRDCPSSGCNCGDVYTGWKPGGG